MNAKFSSGQPKRGDVVVHCGHANLLVHFWQVTGIRFHTPSGLVVPQWLCACDLCAVGADLVAERIQYRGVAAWGGATEAVPS